MLPHVELNRTFWRLGDAEEEDPEASRIRAAFGLDGEDWNKLLERSRVVILAEAGTGKTHELRETARRLQREGKAAFFFRLEDLAVLPLAEALEEGSITELNDWVSGEDLGFLFLDSVDEARLKDSRYFERALRVVARALGDRAARAHIFISARVSDWRATADLSLVIRWLPPPKVEEEAEEEPANPARRTENDVLVVQLAPLTSDQMRQFAAAQGVQNAGSFMDAIARADAQVFAERPQDLVELSAYWIEHGAIASHAELIDFNVRTKLAEPNPDRDVARPLSLAKASEGAMSLAAGLTFTKKDSIILPDQPVDPIRATVSIEAKDILPDWDALEIRTLLSRPLFDEATYGRVRIHHRSIQEYLTARWLCGLLESGKPRRGIERLIFATRYSIDVVVPSMRPVAAWMALRDDRIRDRLIARAPEVLLEGGDASRLPVDVRSRLLHTFADLNEGRSNTGASFDLASIRRLADPRLASTILELLDRHGANDDVRHALLGIIWQGQIADCAQSALSFALDSSMDASTRVYGIRAVAAAGDGIIKRRLADALLDRSGEWSNRELGAAVATLYPQILTLEELLLMLENATPPERYSFDALNRSLEQIVVCGLARSQQESLLSGLIHLIEREPHIERRHCDLSQKYAWLLQSAAKLAEQIITTFDSNEVDFSTSVLRTIELEAQGKHYIPRYRKDTVKLKDLIVRLPKLQHALFWRSIEQRREEEAAKGERLTEWWKVSFMIREILNVGIDDFDVFLEDICKRVNMDDRLVALTAAFTLWRSAGRPRRGRDRIWRAVKGVPELETKLHALLRPGPTPDEIKTWRRQERGYAKQEARQRRHEEQERAHLARHLADRVDDIRAVDEHTKDQCFPDLLWLAHRIAELAGSTFRWGSDRWDLLEVDLSRDVAEAAREGLMRFWRLYEPPLRSESHGDGRTNGVLAGLAGLAIEVRERPNWARRLDEKEARLAARFAMHEMNGLPDWAPDLMDAHPEAFDSVVIPELTWELSLPAGTPEPYHIVSALRYGDESIRQRYRPTIQSLFNECEPAHFHTLESLLYILLQWDGLDASRFAVLARDRYEASEDEGRRLIWLVAWLCVDADGALRTLRAWLDDASNPTEAGARMVAFCNGLMSHHDLRFGTIWRDFERIEVLRDLVPLVYRHVRIEDDNDHRGPYTPNARDNAETTRGYLLNRVAQTPGREAFEALMTFSHELPDHWSRDRMIVLARRRAAEDAQPEAWLASDVSTFGKEAETNPRSARDLFELTCNRLDDLKLDLEEGDASEAATLRRVDQETELRNWFANRLRRDSRGRYSVPPEEELADAKRPDLRIHAPAIDAPVGIELKIADKWSYSQLVERLQNQLVGQYLRDTRSSFAIYLLVWRGEKQVWKETGQPFSFSELVERLRSAARATLQERCDLEDISVVGIDLTRRHTPTSTR